MQRIAANCFATSFIALSLVLAASTQGAERYGIGSPATAEAIARWDRDVDAVGDGLPPGSGTVAEGAALYGDLCAACHGVDGQGGPYDALIGPYASDHDFAGDFRLRRTIGNWWPYATTLFDYVQRAMPMTAPGSLQPDQVYALVAYLLHENRILESDAVLDAASLRAVRMPAQALFFWSQEAQAADRLQRR